MVWSMYNPPSYLPLAQQWNLATRSQNKDRRAREGSYPKKTECQVKQNPWTGLLLNILLDSNLNWFFVLNIPSLLDTLDPLKDFVNIGATHTCQLKNSFFVLLRLCNQFFAVKDQILFKCKIKYQRFNAKGRPFDWYHFRTLLVFDGQYL